MASKKKPSANGTATTTITHEDFCRIWTKAERIEDVCEQTGLDRKAAQMRGYMLRKKGAELKRFSGDRRKIDIDRLNEIIKEAS